MLTSVNGWVSWSAVFALLAALPAASGAQEAKPRQPGEDRWVPSLALISGLTIQSQEGSVETFDFDYIFDPPEWVRGGWMLDEEFSTDGVDLAVSPYVGANLELMSPALALPGRPRLFLGAQILPTFAAARDIAKIQDPTGLAPPAVFPLVDLNPLIPSPILCEDEQGEVWESEQECYPRFGYAENTILGQGAQTTAEIDTLVFGAAVGVAIPFRLRGHTLRVKPSLGWIRYKIEVEGRMVKAQCPPYIPPRAELVSTSCIDFDLFGPLIVPPPPFRLPDGTINPDWFYGQPNLNYALQPGFTREIVLGAQGSQHFNGIGGGVDLEMDVWRAGPFGVSLFLGGSFYRILGDRTLDLSDSAEFDYTEKVREPDDNYDGTEVSLPENTFTANWSFEVDPWMYRAGLGLRFHWLGSRK
jgi:hypothetical protein